MEEGLKHLEFASKAGMEIGDVESSIIASLFFASHCLYHGKPLSYVEDLYTETIRRMRLFQQDSMLQAALPIQQYIQNLTGRAPVPKLLSGDFTPLYDSSGEVDSLVIPYSHYCLGAELAFMFCDLDLAGQMLQKKRILGFDPLAFFYFSKIRLKEALICIGLARTRCHQEKRKNLNIAKGILKQLKAWAKDCPANHLHKQYLVEAELKSLSTTPASSLKQKRLVQGLYDLAIETAVKAGFVDEAALANELAGDCMNCQHERELAGTYWNTARVTYLQWGATEKVKQLENCRSM